MRFGQTTKSRFQKYFYYFLITIIFILCLYYYKQTVHVKYVSMQVMEDENLEKVPGQLLVNGENCMIPNLPVFDKEINKYYNPEKYFNCCNHELLTYISKANGTVKLIINQEAKRQYTFNNIICCYSYVKRKESEEDPDGEISYSPCTVFAKEVVLSDTSVSVTCTDARTGKEIYANAHAFTTLSQVEEKISIPRRKRTTKVLLIGIDSVSRLNFRRTMPLTHDYLKSNNWISYQGYNKVADNTYPNLMALLTGRNFTWAYKECSGITLGMLDRCNFIWYDYDRTGFVTAFAEDLPKINTFNYLRKGFQEPPTDFYFRPYMMASQNITYGRYYSETYCSGPESTGERVLNLISDFSNTFKDYSIFGMFWMNSFSHDDLNNPSMMDQALAMFFQNMAKNFENTFVIFVSDHGIRFGDFRFTTNGWYEERLPFLYIWVPLWFRKEYPQKYENLKANYNKLTTPYDLYMTLQDILKIHDETYEIVQSTGCKKCHTLFEPVSLSRGCSDVSINQHYCTCINYESADKNSNDTLSAVNYLLNELESITKKSKYAEMCAKYSLDKVLTATISKSKMHSTKPTYMLLVIKTIPEAVFEATIKLFNDDSNRVTYNISGDISRIDSYSAHSKCVDDFILRKYCYCKE